MSGFLRRLSPRHADALRPATAPRTFGFDPATPVLPEAPSVDDEAAAPDIPLQSLPRTPARAAPERATTVAGPARPPVARPRPDMSESEPATPSPSSAPGAPGVGTRATSGRPAAVFDDVAIGSTRVAIPGAQAMAAARPSSPLSPLSPGSPAHAAPASRPAFVDVHAPVPSPGPLSPGTVERVEARAEASCPPVIHLHIDRIDVRAAPRPATPAPTRPRAVPEPQSLHDYLTGKQRG